MQNGALAAVWRKQELRIVGGDVWSTAGRAKMVEHSDEDCLGRVVPAQGLYPKRIASELFSTSIVLDKAHVMPVRYSYHWLERSTMADKLQQVLECVLELLEQMTAGSDHPKIGADTDPIRGLGLCSDDGIDFACEISARLGFHFPDDKNPFIDDTGHRSRPVAEIVTLVYSMLPSGTEATHA